MLSSKAPHRIVRRKEMRLCEKHLGVNHHESESKSHSVMSDSLQPHGLYSPWNLQARILEWVAFPFAKGSSQPRDQTQVSRIAGRLFTS